MAKKLISEQSVNDAHQSGCNVLYIDPTDIVTPAAYDRARQLHIELSTEKPPSQKPVSRNEPRAVKAGKIIIGSDHGGYAMKTELIGFIRERGFDVEDAGTYSEESCDYPDFAYAVAYSVARGDAWRGIMIDGAGIGSCMAANKVPGIRAASCTDEFTARNSREHNDANVLTLGSRGIGIEVAKNIVTIFLDTWFGGGRHAKRVEKIMDIEKRFLP
jgi:ribose 5-phosphate isomerase B